MYFYLNHQSAVKIDSLMEKVCTQMEEYQGNVYKLKFETVCDWINFTCLQASGAVTKCFKVEKIPKDLRLGIGIVCLKPSEFKTEGLNWLLWHF